MDASESPRSVPYVPPPHGGEWQRAEDGETGLDPVKVTEAASFAATFETPWSRDLGTVIGQGYFEPPPWNEIIGPVAPRGGPNGVILHRGFIAAEWGDTIRADMTFSVAKSYLALLAGVAVERGSSARSTSPSPAASTMAAFHRRTTPKSPGATSCSRPRNGRGRCGTSPISSTAIAISIWSGGASKAAASRAPRGRCRSPGAIGSTTMSG